MKKPIRIGTRDSQLAIWQATRVKELLAQHNFSSELVFIKSEGDIDLETPLYEIGVQGIFTRSLDIALLNNRIDIAVHSMKDVPTQLPKRVIQAAVLERASYKDLLVYKGELSVVSSELAKTGIQPNLATHHSPFTVATSSIRRKAQWLHRYPHHIIENLRGNVNTRLKKVEEHNWNGAVFAAAGLERINLRPANSIELDWMLPAPAQGAIMLACRETDEYILNACKLFNDAETALCAKIERDFLRTLLGGCSTPISALAQIEKDTIVFKGNILSPDGSKIANIEETAGLFENADLGARCAIKLLKTGGQEIVDGMKKQDNYY